MINLQKVLYLWKIQTDGRSLFIFSLLFFSGMWISKGVHPIWFSSNDALPLFGVSYSVMALAGAAAFLFGPLVQNVGLRRSMLLGCIFYSIGLGLRIFPNLPSAVASGLFSGIGASLSLLTMRVWVFDWEGDGERARIFSYSTLSSHLAKGVIMLVLGAFLVTMTGTNIYPIILFIAAMLPLVAVIIVWQDLPEKPEVNEEQKIVKPHSRKGTKTAFLCLNSVLVGFFASFVLPYLPVLLILNGISEANAISLIAISSICAAATQPVFLPWLSGPKAMHAFLSVSLITGIATMLLDNFIGVWALLTILVVRSIGSNSVHLSEKSIEMSLIDKLSAPITIAKLQSAFLVGDMLGGGIAGFAWASGKTSSLLNFVGIGMITTALIFSVSVWWVKFREVQV